MYSAACAWLSDTGTTGPQVFMLQLEGAKRWRLHRCPEGPLPRRYCWDYEGKDLGDLNWDGQLHVVVPNL